MLPMSTQTSFGMTAADLTWLANDLVRRPTLWPLGNQGVSARSVAVSVAVSRCLWACMRLPTHQPL